MLALVWEKTTYLLLGKKYSYVMNMLLQVGLTNFWKMVGTTKQTSWRRAVSMQNKTWLRVVFQFSMDYHNDTSGILRLKYSKVTSHQTMT